MEYGSSAASVESREIEPGGSSSLWFNPRPVISVHQTESI